MLHLPSEAMPAAAFVIFLLTYAALAWGRIPGTRIDRTGIAIAGAAAMLATGAVTMRDAAAAIDVPTIALLLGMMIVVAYLQISGFFGWVVDRVVARFSGAYSLLAITISVAGALSALLVNDVVCVALTPLMLHVCRRMQRPPVPYLIALATASNVGSVATIAGNPQNMIVGSLSGISYLDFAARLTPIAVIGLVLNFFVVALVYRRQLSCSSVAPQPDAGRPVRVHRQLMLKTLAVTSLTVVAFFAGVPIAVAALVAAAVCLVDRIRPDKAYGRVDWKLLAMFAGLFIVVRAFEVQVVRDWELETLATRMGSPVVTISGLSLILSNLVSNVPAVLIFKPLMEVMPDPKQAWLALAMSSTFAGNLTLLGSVANLIVVETARRSGIEIGFVEYLKAGVVLTLLTTAVGVAWLTMTCY